MKILVVGSSKNENTIEVREYYQKYVSFFRESAVTLPISDVIVNACLIDDLIISVGDNSFTIYDSRNNRELKDYDVLFMRGVGFKNNIDIIGTINEYAHINNIAIINKYSNIRDSSKLLQATYFFSLGIPVARTLMVTSAVLESKSLDWEFPCVMKAVDGSHGDDNHIVKSIDEVKWFVLNHSKKRFVLQRLIPNDCDYRILVVGAEAIVISRTANGNSHLNNTSKGGLAKIVDIDKIPDDVMSNVKKIMNYYGMSIAGVDVLADKNTNEYFFLEVNAQPQLMTGAFVSEKKILVGKLLSKLSNNI